jgi:hypothetical protein
MRRKYHFILFLIILLCPMIHLSDNLLLEGSEAEILSTEPRVEIRPLAEEFDIAIHVGDPFSNPYKTLEFNSDDVVTITGAVKNLGYTGGLDITVAIWLVTANSPFQVIWHIQNLSGALPIGASMTLKELNANADVNWSIANFYAGTYRLLAQVYIDKSLKTQTISGKAIVLRKLQAADFSINYTIIAKNPHFSYQLTNIGNYPISGDFDIRIEKYNEGTSSWNYFMDVNESTHADGESIVFDKGNSLIGNATWIKPDGIAGIFRLYIGILDANGDKLCNLNNSLPFEHQGNLYIDSDKYPRLSIERAITSPTRYLDPEFLNVSLTLSVVGLPPSEIGIIYYNVLPGNIHYGVADIELEEELVDAVVASPSDTLYWVNESYQGRIASSARSGNKIYFNSTTKGCANLSSMLVGQQLAIKYYIQANFSPEVKRPIEQELGDGRRLVYPSDDLAWELNIGYQEAIVLPKTLYYKTLMRGIEISKDTSSCMLKPNDAKQVGIVLYLEGLYSKYSSWKVNQLHTFLIDWASSLIYPYKAVLYYLDDFLFSDEAGAFFGFEAYSWSLWSNGMKSLLIEDDVNRSVLSDYIQMLTTSAAEEYGWDYIVIVGGDSVIPMCSVEHPLIPFNQDLDNTSYVATDLLYGDLIPEPNPAVTGYVPEVAVSRLPGDPLDIINLIKAGNTSSTGRALMQSFFRGEDTVRELAWLWNNNTENVVTPDDCLYESEGNYTRAKKLEWLNPGSDRYFNDPDNFPYAFILYSGHGNIAGITGLDKWDVSGFDDYTDGHRPFLFLKTCSAGYIGDPGKTSNGVPYTEADSFALEYLQRGLTGLIGSTRTSYSRGSDLEKSNLTYFSGTLPGAPISQSGFYLKGNIKFEGFTTVCFLVDADTAGNYETGGIDLNGNGIYGETVNGQSEDMAFNTYFESPSATPETYFWRYYFKPQLDDTGNWSITLYKNKGFSLADYMAKYFIGDGATGLMQGADVGTAFFNALQNYWTLHQTIYTNPNTKNAAYSRTILLEYNLYGIPIYHPEMQELSSSIIEYNFDNTGCNDYGFNASFGIMNYSHQFVAGKDLFQIPGGELLQGPLEPIVPFLIENVSIPAGFSISDIRVVANSSTELPGTYNLSIAPEDEAMEDILKTQDSRAWLGKYPDKLFDFVTKPQRDGSVNVFLTVFPFQWDADTGKVVYYSNITLDVDIEDTWEDSVYLRTTKSVSFKKIGRGSNFLIQLQITNNGSNTIYNLEFEEFIEGTQKYQRSLSCLAPSGSNSSYAFGYLVAAPTKYFSGWVTTETSLTFSNAAGTEYVYMVTVSTYLTSWLGIILLILCLIVAVAVTVLILKYR